MKIWLDDLQDDPETNRTVPKGNVEIKKSNITKNVTIYLIEKDK